MEIIAHRGASTFAPENTLAAFQLAVDMGAKSIEFDVQMTKDGKLVVIHDYTLNRTTNGQGYVMESNYDYIQSLDAGGWYSEDFKNQRIPLLSQVLNLIPKEMVTHIEIKKTAFEKRPIELEVLKVVLDTNRLAQTVFSSFEHGCLLELLKHEGVKVGVLVGSNIQVPERYLELNQMKSYSFNQSAEFVSPGLVQQVHEAGLKLLSYTVDDPSMAELFRQMGVDGIFTNNPKLLGK